MNYEAPFKMNAVLVWDLYHETLSDPTSLQLSIIFEICANTSGMPH